MAIARDMPEARPGVIFKADACLVMAADACLVMAYDDRSLFHC
jgi:hypothetical protein